MLLSKAMLGGLFFSLLCWQNAFAAEILRLECYETRHDAYASFLTGGHSSTPISDQSIDHAFEFDFDNGVANFYMAAGGGFSYVLRTQITVNTATSIRAEGTIMQGYIREDYEVNIDRVNGTFKHSANQYNTSQNSNVMLVLSSGNCKKAAQPGTRF